MFPKKIFLALALFISSTVFSQTYEHPNYYYNQAISYQQQNQLGLALLNSKKALRLQPQNPLFREQFFNLRQEIGLPALYSEDPLYNQITAQFIGIIRPQFRAIIGAIWIIVIAVGIAFLIFNKSPQNRHKLTISILIASLLGTVFVIPSQIYYYTIFKAKDAVITEGSPGYEEASLDSQVITTLPSGTEIRIISTNQNFSLVKSIDGQEFWIPDTHFTLLFSDTDTVTD